jgi:hypothetical protein
MNYLELVNTAMDEAGIDLDQLTELDFANPSEKMQRKFKRWVSDAWRGVQMSREGWSFLNGRAFGVIKPRLYIEQGNLTAAPVIGEMYEGAGNGSLFTVAKVVTLSGSWATGDATAFIDLNNFSGDVEFGETFNRVSGTPVLSAFSYKGRGRYDLKEIAADFDDLDYQSVYLSNNITDGSDYTQKLRFVEWNLWKNFQEGTANDQSRPVLYTQTGDNLFDFFPALDKEYNLYFNYSRKPQNLQLASDVPVLDEEFHDVIYWSAVEAYGRYDEKPSVVRQAQEALRPMMMQMERKYLPKIGWAPNQFSEYTY